MTYEEIDNISDVIEYLDGGNTLTGSQTIALARKLGIDPSRIEKLQDDRKQPSDKQKQREFEEANALTNEDIVGVNDIDDIARLAGQGKIFSDYQIWALSKSLQVSEGEVNDAIEQGYAQVDDSQLQRITGTGGGTGYIGGLMKKEGSPNVSDKNYFGYEARRALEEKARELYTKYPEFYYVYNDIFRPQLQENVSKLLQEGAGLP